MEHFGAGQIQGACKLLKRWSGRPDSNRRRPAWEAGILPLNYSRAFFQIIDLAYFRELRQTAGVSKVSEIAKSTSYVRKTETEPEDLLYRSAVAIHNPLETGSATIYHTVR